MAGYSQASNKHHPDSIYTEFGLQGLTSSGKYAPFLMHSSHYGTVSHLPHSGMAFVKVGKDMRADDRLWDYEFGVSAWIGGDSEGFQFMMPELYAKARLHLFDASIGIEPRTWGNEDEDLSSGGLLFSKNAAAMPRATIGITEYRDFPYTHGYLEIKGGISHGWIIDNTYIKNAYLHHKYIGGRIGGRLPVNISYEFQHVAQWGGHSPVYGNLGNSFEGWWNALLAKEGGMMANDQLNAQGNHIGSQQIGLDINVKDWQARFYWQTLFEDGPIRIPWRAMNKPDGLWGVVISQKSFPFISKVIYEFLNTTDQAGPFHDKDGFLFGGSDSYFTNGIYRGGWNYFYRTIGSPLITSPIYNDDGTIHTKNNRVRTHYLGIMGDIYGYRYKVRMAHTQNWGRYNAIHESNNTSAVIEVEKYYEKAWGLHFAASVGADFGTQFGNSVGVKLSVKKRIGINY